MYTHTFSQRMRYNFDRDWQVFVGDSSSPGFSDGTWKEVTLPYAWNEDEAFQKDIRDLSTGIAWYKKRFRVPAGEKVFLEFEGVRQAAKVYLNGAFIGMHENGITAFGFDISDKVRRGEENVLAVRVDNSWDYRELSTGQKYQWEDKNFNANYGGITKHVYLHVMGTVYQTLPLGHNIGVYVFATDCDVKGRKAVLHAESEVTNESEAAQQVEYAVEVRDLDGKVVRRFEGEQVRIGVGEKGIVKAVGQLDGVHFWSWGYGYLYTVKTMLKIDGKVVDEVNTRTGFRKTAFKDGLFYLNDRVMMVHGYAQRTSNEWPAVGLSVPAWLSDYSNRLMVESGGNLVRWMHIAPWKQDIESCDRVGLLQAMPAGDAEADVSGTRWEQRKAVMRDVIIYNRNNPSVIFYEAGNKGISEEHMREMKAIRDQYDPYGGRAIGAREMLDSKVAEYGGEMLYTNKSSRIPLWAMEYSRDEGARKYWDDYTPPYHKDSPDYNRNMESHAVENVKRWYEFWKERPGTGKRVSSGGVNIVFSDTNTHHRGDENYRRSGEVDAMRIPKENFFVHQVMWDGWVVPEKDALHIIGHWNYKAGMTKDVYVVSTAEKVELLLNGRSLGYGKKSDGFLFTFPGVSWEAGRLTAIGYKGKEVCRGEKVTTGEAVALRLKNIASPAGFVADGHDLAMIEVEVVDKHGVRVPTALDTVHFELDGPAEWRGGIAVGEGNFILSKDLPVEGGVNRVLVRSKTHKGKAVVAVTAHGLKGDKVVLESVEKGSELPVNLARGETPLTPSYKEVRKAVRIVGGTDSMRYSYDDNERTDWTNDGQLGTAWVEYELERPVVVGEVEMKLSGFKSKVYPIRISVDGVEVFRGKTPLSLGYVTLVCKPVKGRKVRVELLEEVKEEGGKMVEVTGKKLEDGVKGREGKGRLSVIEVEVYEE